MPQTRTGEGWLSLGVMLDLGRRRVVGWVMADHLRGALTLAALRMAITRQRPAPGPIAQADHGSQDVASDHRAALASTGAHTCLSRQGNLLDTAPMQGFSTTLRAELVDDVEHAIYSTARHDVFAFMAAWYDRRRPHSALGYITREQIERNAA